MATKLELLCRIYQDLEGSYNLHDAKEKARSFFKTVLENVSGEELDDVWVQISKEWDLNLWNADKLGDGTKKGMQITLYPVSKDAHNHFKTDTDYPVGLTMWS